MKVKVCQLNPMVGDIEANTELVIRTVERFGGPSQVLVFPELVLTGYPPDDLLLRPSLAKRIELAIEKILSVVSDQWIILGYPESVDRRLFNSALVANQGEIKANYRKHNLPNYRVFDEKRYFEPGDSLALVNIKGFKVGICICEDLWDSDVGDQYSSSGAELLISINASPFDMNKHNERLHNMRRRVKESNIPLIYAQMFGGQDDLIFDGGSFALNSDGSLAMQAPWFEEQVAEIVIGRNSNESLRLRSCQIAQAPCKEEMLYQALVLSVRDYVDKNRFRGVVLGLSGGIDSALTLAIAVDALGAERVQAVMMPFRYTSDMSQTDAANQAGRMGVEYSSIGIEPMYEAFMSALDSEFHGAKIDKTEENIQARCRGLTLMAISNKKGYMVLTTGNKSEMSVGYATLYGDMAGGFAVLKDVSKMAVYALARYRNTLSEVIPVNVIERPPSAELAPDQIDQDSLPEYDILDRILELYIEQDQSAEDIISQGFETDVVYKVLRLVDINEYKRQQSALGPRVTSRSFGRDRRYPITNGWRLGS